MLPKHRASATEPDGREHSLRPALPLVAAAVLFGLGVLGLLSVLPYSIGARGNPLFVTSPTGTPSTASEELRVQALAASGLIAEEISAATAQPAPEPTAAPAPVYAAAVPEQRVSGLTPQPDPPTPTPTIQAPTATPVSSNALQPPPTATPTRTPGFIPDSREPGPVKQAEPVTAFIDPMFQQPAPVAPYTSGSPSGFPVSPGR